MFLTLFISIVLTSGNVALRIDRKVKSIDEDEAPSGFLLSVNQQQHTGFDSNKTVPSNSNISLPKSQVLSHMTKLRILAFRDMVLNDIIRRGIYSDSIIKDCIIRRAVMEQHIPLDELRIGAFEILEEFCIDSKDFKLFESMKQRKNALLSRSRSVPADIAKKLNFASGNKENLNGGEPWTCNLSSLTSVQNKRENILVKSSVSSETVKHSSGKQEFLSRSISSASSVEVNDSSRSSSTAVQDVLSLDGTISPVDRKESITPRDSCIPTSPSDSQPTTDDISSQI
ncbi:hypothetical protein AB6A40_010512 [Gnathostoma spinigerum]|uniref:Uncharacterized protein n=1 Tax=Gnathostoma spinigerum TaxID=75299 RepID=A0ABD6F1V9_9BILA